MPRKLKKGHPAVAHERLKKAKAAARKAKTPSPKDDMVNTISRTLTALAGSNSRVEREVRAAEREFKRSKSRSRRPKHA